jgi:UDP-N-acetylmuramoyl-tripeptide--D-alanyl-D-alanine ligase
VPALKAFWRRYGWPKWVVVGVLTLAFGGALAWRSFGDHTLWRLFVESPYRGRCSKVITRAVVERSLALGTRFMLVHQRPEGNFDYEYDWRDLSYSDDDNEVRQAGALWGLALIEQAAPSRELEAGIEKGLAFFEAHGVENARGERCVAYPGKAEPGIGTVALMALTYVDYLRASGTAISAERRAEHERRMNAYLKEVVASINPDGLWFGAYDPHTCAPHGAASPYSDGEALLALVKAAKYAGKSELFPLALRAADTGHRLNVKEALAQDPDSDTTKAYYQWSTMAFYELATSGLPDTARFGEYVLAQSDWEIDVHQTLTRQRNTGYAYEGLIPAYDWARRRGDTTRTAKYGCVIDLALERLISWQVGGPLSTRYTSAVEANDKEAIGGVQNERDEPALRIDVTQHQTHALIYARDFIYTK